MLVNVSERARRWYAYCGMKNYTGDGTTSPNLVWSVDMEIRFQKYFVLFNYLKEGRSAVEILYAFATAKFIALPDY